MFRDTNSPWITLLIITIMICGSCNRFERFSSNEAEIRFEFKIVGHWLLTENVTSFSSSYVLNTKQAYFDRSWKAQT